MKKKVKICLVISYKDYMIKQTCTLFWENSGKNKKKKKSNKNDK